ncbi:MAG: hypothetical protein KJO34_00125 [Deltaproteobacteria bacterium]|nr:hypothetical protein [Deltaproteobacteria bacterium]
MKIYDTTFSKKQLTECMRESSDAGEICRLALQKIRALEKKVGRLSETTKPK